MNFNLLCAALGIKPEHPVSEKLALLKHWFTENVSSDLLFSGNEAEQYAQYKQVTEAYLEHVLPKTKQDLGKTHRQFDGANVICALAAMGFDRVLLSLKPERTLLNTPDPHDLSPLHLAAVEGHVKTTEVLLSLGADSCTLNKQSQYPLFSALMVPMLHDDVLKQNKIAIFRLLRDKGTQPLNHRDDSGNTILHQMVLSDFIDLIQETLATEPSLAAIKNNHTLYPIHTAILNNQIQSVALLLQVKEGANLADKNGWTALHYAAIHAQQPLLKECCKFYTNVDVLDHQKRTPLMLAAEYENLAALKILIKRGAQTDLTDAHGFTLLHFAVQSGNLATVRWLLDNTKTEVNAKDSQYHTPLYINEHEHDKTGNKAKISALLHEHGANLGSSMTYS